MAADLAGKAAHLADDDTAAMPTAGRAQVRRDSLSAYGVSQPARRADGRGRAR